MDNTTKDAIEMEMKRLSQIVDDNLEFVVMNDITKSERDARIRTVLDATVSRLTLRRIVQKVEQAEKGR